MNTAVDGSRRPDDALGAELQPVLIFSGDFLESVFNMAIEYRFARGHDQPMLEFAAAERCLRLNFLPRPPSRLP
jgi:hypothetical protein